MNGKKGKRMNKKDLKHFKNLIAEKKKNVLIELGYLEQSSMNETVKESTGDLSAYSFHMADHGTDTMEREKAFFFASREGRYLHHLNDALKRIEKGTYGICRTCNNPIDKKRLEAVPHATQCIECKKTEEKREKGM